jgi:hypothetical protein
MAVGLFTWAIRVSVKPFGTAVALRAGSAFNHSSATTAIAATIPAITSNHNLGMLDLTIFFPLSLGKGVPSPLPYSLLQE